MADWYYAIDDKQTGPVSRQELRQLVEKGLVTATTQIWREGMQSWTSAEKVKAIWQSLGSPGEEPISGERASLSGKMGTGIFKGIEKVADKAARLVEGEEEIDRAKNAAIFLKQNYFGGQTWQGISLKFMKSPLGKIFVALFSPVVLFFRSSNKTEPTYSSRS